MRFVSDNFITIISPYVPFAITLGVSFALCVICTFLAVEVIKRQQRLNKSISLVELKTPRAHYIVFIFIVALCSIYTIFMMADSSSPEVLALSELFSMSRPLALASLGSMLSMLICMAFLLVVLAIARSAVVDKGIIMPTKFLDWYHVHDYIIDEQKGVVVLSGHSATFAVLLGTTAPLKVGKNDVAKLKFILNKNKNKFSGFSEE